MDSYKNFIKKAIYFSIVYNVVNIFFSNLLLFKKGHIFKLVIDGWTLIFLIGFFVYGIVGIGIMKFFSKKIDKFIYESNELICYVAFIYRGLTWLEVLFFEFLDRYYWSIPLILITFGCFIGTVLVLYRFWKYRIEIAGSIFISATIFAHTDLEKSFYHIFEINNPSNFLQGAFLAGVSIIFLLITLFLRKKGLYDFRSRKEKWQESIGEGPYRFS